MTNAKNIKNSFGLATAYFIMPANLFARLSKTHCKKCSVLTVSI